MTTTETEIEIELIAVPDEPNRHSAARTNRMELIKRNMENFVDFGAVSQVILAASSFDHHGKDFPHMVETALRRGDATVLGQLIITAVSRWRDAEAEGKTNGL